MPVPDSRIGEGELAGLPGAELVLPGLEDLEKGLLTERALAVLVAAPRLTALGLPVPAGQAVNRSYEHALYELLEEADPQSAHSRYNALLQRLASFVNAADHLPR